ncbi:MAG: hypothetical protein J4G04_07935 [Nitrosopumilaceae archaeon]|nr:hypothetical protein [Nitrosopumilaceae archaeon]
MEDDWVDILAECRRAIDESLEELVRIEEKYPGEDAVEAVGLQQLHDMAEDAAEAGRVRRAETNLAWRYAG